LILYRYHPGIGAQEGETEFLERVKNAPRRFLEGGPMGMVFERALRAVGATYRAVANSPGRKRPAATEVPAAPAMGLFNKLFGATP